MDAAGARALKERIDAHQAAQERLGRPAEVKSARDEADSAVLPRGISPAAEPDNGRSKNDPR
jgi:hypothetical protein